MKTTAEKVMAVIREMENSNDVYHKETSIIKRCIGSHPQLSKKAVRAALMELSASGLLLHNGYTYSVSETAYDEDYLAQTVAGYIVDNTPREEFDTEAELRRAETSLGVCLSISQRLAVTGSLGNRLSIITGGPGSGKTTMLKALCAALPNATPEDVALAAPTGKAARRLAEQTGRNATTVHGLIYSGLSTRKYDDGALRPRLLVIDEASMMSIPLLADLLRSVSAETRVVLVGDPAQLPAVGAGQVLHTLLNCGLPVYRLTDNFRQASGSKLAEAVDRIRAGHTVLSYDSSIQMLTTPSSADTEMLVTALYSSAYSNGVNVQILTAFGEAGGPCSALSLNELVRESVNPAEGEKLEVQIGSKRFRLGDEVIMTSNYGDARNGDIGHIVGVGAGEDVYIEVEYDFSDAPYRYKQSELEDYGLLDLAYAITVHKSQGSEYDTVIIPLDKAHMFMWNSNMIYTAVSRAKKSVILIGEPDVLTQAIQTPLQECNSALKNKIQWNLPPVAV